jgi:hypothetical protein
MKAQDHDIVEAVEVREMGGKACGLVTTGRYHRTKLVWISWMLDH